MVNSTTKKKSLIVGDSRTYHFATQSRGVGRSGISCYGRGNDGNYYYASSGKGYNWLKTNLNKIAQTAKTEDSDYIIIRLGVNDVDSMKSEDQARKCADEYAALAKQLEQQSGKKVVFCSVESVYDTPSNPYRRNDTGTLWVDYPGANKRIEAFNNQLKSHTEFAYIDTYNWGKSKLDNNRSKYFTDGYLHFQKPFGKMLIDHIQEEFDRIAQNNSNQATTQTATQAQQNQNDNTSATTQARSTADRMLTDQQKAQEVKEDLAAVASSGNAGRGGFFSRLFTDNENEARDIFSKVLISALSYLLTGKFPGSKTNSDNNDNSKTQTNYSSNNEVPSATGTAVNNEGLSATGTAVNNERLSATSTLPDPSQLQYGNIKNYVVNNFNKRGNTAQISDLIVKYSKKYGVDPCFAFAIAETESRFTQNVGSPAGAYGVFQLMPQTATTLKVNRNDTEQNIEGGIKLLSQLMKRYNGDLLKVAKAYNWGPGNLEKYLKKGISAQNAGNSISEVRNYAPSVLKRMDKYRNMVGINQSVYAQYYGNSQNQNYLAMNQSKGGGRTA